MDGWRYALEINAEIVQCKAILQDNLALRPHRVTVAICIMLKLLSQLLHFQNVFLSSYHNHWLKMLYYWCLRSELQWFPFGAAKLQKHSIINYGFVMIELFTFSAQVGDHRLIILNPHRYSSTLIRFHNLNITNLPYLNTITLLVLGI